MTSDDPERVEMPEGADGHHVSWFAPERPVIGTVFVRDEQTTDGSGRGSDY